LDSRKVVLHTEKTSYEIDGRQPLKDFELELTEPIFFRCNKTCLVNLNYIDYSCINNGYIMINERKIYLRKDKMKRLLQLLNIILFQF
ncbi:MAG: LytTR family transcriptional regulator DNA-binding domain-containing protein, partial [Clostridioides sp.]|nr:LytTR family transcriptional regulator DNA-binding domain-containing protein [Clostridioides sp.]